MKKTIITFVLMLLASSAFAQIPGISFGPKIALNFSKFSTNYDEVEASMKPGFDLGLFARFGNKLYLQPELTYSFQSSKIKNIADEMANFSLKTSTLDVPVLIGYKLLDLGAGNLRAFAGPNFSFVLGDNFDEFGNAASFNVGGQAGLGIDLLKLTIDVRYGYIFTNMADDSGVKVHNNALMVSLGWKLL